MKQKKNNLKKLEEITTVGLTSGFNCGTNTYIELQRAELYKPIGWWRGGWAEEE